MSPHPRCSMVHSLRFLIAAIQAFVFMGGWGSLTMAAEPPLPLTITKLDRTTPVDFGKEVMPILKRNCLACHHKTDAEGGLVLESLASILKGGESGTAVVAKDPGSSLLMSRTTGHVEPLMPPEDNTVGAVPLSADELGLLQLWIEQGAMGSDEVEHQSIKWQPIAESMRSVYALDVSPDGQRTAFGRGNRVMVTDLANPTELLPLVDSSLNLGPVADVDLIQSIAFSPDGMRIATGGFRTVRLWKRTHAAPSETPSPLHKFASGKAAQSFAFDNSLASVAIVNAIGDVEVWDLAAGTRRATISGQRDAIVGLDWAGTTGRLLVANEAGVITAYDGIAGNEIAKLDLETSLERLSTCSDGDHLAVIDQEHRVQCLRLIASTEQTPPAIAVVNKSIADVADATAIALLSKPTLMLVIASESRGVMIVDLMTHQVARTFEAKAVVDAITLSSDETKLVTGSRDGAVRVWSLADGKLLATCQGTSEEQLSVAKANRDAVRQKTLVERLHTKTAELQGLLKKEDESLAMVTKSRDEAKVAHDANETKLVEAVALVTAAQAALDKATADLAAQSNNAEAKAVAEKATKELETHRAAVAKAEAEKVKSDAELVKQQRAVDAAMLAQKRATEAIPAHQSKVQTESRRLARLDQTLAQTQKHLSPVSQEVVDVSLSVDATLVAVMQHDGSLVVYRASDGQAVSQFSPAMTSSVIDKVTRTEPQLAMIGNELCRLNRSGVLECLSLRDHWQLERTIGSIGDASTLVDRVTALDFHPDGMTLAVGTGEASRSGIVKIFAVENGEQVRDLGELHTDTVLGIDFSPDGKTLATSAADRIIRLVDVATGTTVRTLEGHTHHVLSVAWQDDGRTLASAGADQSIKVWDGETGETTQTISGFSQELTSIKFVESTDQLVASCGNGQVRLANAKTGAAVRNFDAAKDFLFTIALTPDGKRLVAGGQSGTVRIWNVADGAVVAELKP